VKKTLLLIDDEPNIIEIVFAMLERPDLQLRLAHNGEEALDILRRYPVDAILSDIRMPRMNGVRLVQEVRKLGLVTPVLLMSGYADYSELLTALRAGVIDIVEKPFSLDQLVKSVDHVLELGSNMRRIQNELKVISDGQKFEPKDFDFLRYVATYMAKV
jgi:DNA-binding NtrC family response regulator